MRRLLAVRPRRAHSYARAQQLALQLESARQGATELLVELALRIDLRRPLRGIDRGRGAHALLRDVEPGELEVALARYPAERRLDGADRAVGAIEHPLQHAHVLAVAGPQEPAVVAL